MADRFSKWTGKALRYMIPLAVSALLVVWLFHKVDIHEMMKVIRDGCNFRWIILMMAITTLSHIIRGIRWGIQLRGVGVPRMPVVAESVSISAPTPLTSCFQAWGRRGDVSSSRAGRGCRSPL